MSAVELLIEEGIGVITINRPESLNALNTQVLEDLSAVLESVETEEEVKVVIITGAGNKAFVAGADIAEMQNKSVDEAYRFSRLGQQVFGKIETMPKPVIAAVNGFALGGGCELAMACDIRVASENARFGQPEINLGIIPGFAGTQRLPRLVGKGKALELIMTGDMITAADAEKLGLVNKVVSGDVLEAAREMAKKIASKGALALHYCKAAVHYGLQADMETGSAYEAGLFGVCFASNDRKEGIAAFLEKRKPQFKGC